MVVFFTEYILKQLLGCNGSSLTKIGIRGKASEVLSFFQYLPPLSLTNVSELFLVRDDVGEQEELFSFVRGIDFDRFFPSLKGIVFCHTDRNSFNAEGQDDDSSEEDNDGAIIAVPPEVFYRSGSVTSLDFYSDSYKNISFNQLRRTFSAMTSLHVRSLSADNMLILWQVVRLWPGLEELHLQGETSTLWWNYDSELCGINREEMEYLWEQDQEFLRNVHIVPIKSCLSTLPSKLDKFNFFANDDPLACRYPFL